VVFCYSFRVAEYNGEEQIDVAEEDDKKSLIYSINDMFLPVKTFKLL
jgi:hypothetical protein